MLIRGGVYSEHYGTSFTKVDKSAIFISRWVTVESSNVQIEMTYVNRKLTFIQHNVGIVCLCINLTVYWFINHFIGTANANKDPSLHPDFLYNVWWNIRYKFLCWMRANFLLFALAHKMIDEALWERLLPKKILRYLDPNLKRLVNHNW